VRYVKPHGALYNTIVTDAGQAGAVVEAVRRYDPALPVLGLPGSQWLSQAGAAGLTAVPEGFADRAYTPGGRLVSRRQPGAVLHDPDVIAARCVELARTGKVRAVDGSVVDMRVRSLCIHGDTPGAVQIGQRVRAALLSAGVELRAFALGD